MMDDDEGMGGMLIDRRRDRENKQRADAFAKKMSEKAPLERETMQDGKTIFETEVELYKDANSDACGFTPYMLLLERGYELMAKNNPNMTSRKKCRILPPIVTPSGSRRTLYSNMRETVDHLKREFDHLKEYLYAELGTNGAVDGNGRLLLRGRFRANQVQAVLLNYAKAYVICENCASPNTNLARDNATRLYFLKCQNCNSRRSVSAIRSGYRATQRGDRRALRNAVGQQ